jgi:Fe-Mn family superoxide dismutase
MPYEMKSLSCNPGALSGLSEKIIDSHYENNYGSVVGQLQAAGGEVAAR